MRNSFAWRDKISGLQRKLLSVSSVLGVVLAFGGIQLSVRGHEVGSWIAAFGMFIAAEMRWGMQSLYNTLENKRPQWLARFGYANFFWLVFGVALILNLFGFISILFLFTDWLTTGELPFDLGSIAG